MKKAQFDIILKAFIYFCLFLVSDNAKDLFGYSPFTIGFFVATCYFSKNFALTFSTYVLSGIFHDPSVEIIICRVSAGLTFFLVSYTFTKLKRKINLPILNLITLFCRLPETVYAISSGVGIYLTLTSVIVGQVTAYIAGVGFYALLVRGIRVRFTVDELVCICGLMLVLSCGLFPFEIIGFKPFYAICSFVVITTTYALGPYGVALGAVIGIGAGIAGDAFVISRVVCGSLAVLSFRNLSPYLASASYLLTVCGVGYFLGGEGFTTLDVLSLLLGSAVFCALPKGVMKELSAILCAVRERYGGRGIVNRNRLEISRKLSTLASLFWDLSSIVSSAMKSNKSELECQSEISSIVVKNFCANCPKENECEQILKGKTDELLIPAVSSALKNGKATLLDLPTYMTGSCIKVGSLIPEINNTVSDYLYEKKENGYTENGKLLLAEQLFLTGELLGSTSIDMSKAVGFDTAKERIVVDELAHQNVVCSEVVIEKDQDRIIAFIKGAKERKRKIEKVVSKIMKKNMSVYIDNDGERNGFDMVYLSAKTPRDMAFGQVSKAKIDGQENGDSRLILRVDKDKYLFAIADGMGSGDKANEQSVKAVNMIESFYKAGFNRDTVIGLTNKLLTFTGGERYNTLDMCIVDLTVGECDFIKMGACPAFIKRGDEVSVIEGESLPMGAFDEIKPSIIKRKIKENDMIVLVSDGVTDSVGADELGVLLQKARTPNPQELASIIKKRATERGALDDISVIVGKVYPTK